MAISESAPDLAQRARALLDLHTAPEILVLANVWDVASAQVVAATDGVRVLATASHSIASTFGFEDGENIPLNLHLDMVGLIVAAVDLPVTMDFEAGYGDPGETVRRAIDIGVVGGNLEDRMKPLEEAVADVEAVLRAGRDAGAPVVFVPGVVARDEIEALVDGLGPQKLSVISVPGKSLPARELEQLGVARVSTGPFTQRVALTALQDATVELLAGGVLPERIRPLN